MAAIYPAPTQAFLSPLKMTDELQGDVRLNTGSAILQKEPEHHSFGNYGLGGNGTIPRPHGIFQGHGRCPFSGWHPSAARLTSGICQPLWSLFSILSSLPEASSCLMIVQWFLSHTPLPVQQQTSPTFSTLPLKHAQYLDTVYHSAGSTQVAIPVLLLSESTSRNSVQQASSLFVHFGGKAFLEWTVPGQPLWLCTSTMALSLFPVQKHIPALGLLHLLFSLGVLPQMLTRPALLPPTYCSSVTASEGPSLKSRLPPPLSP